MPSLGCKVLCVINNFFVLWFIHQSSSLVYFKNGPEYHTRWAAKIFIPLMQFLRIFLISKIFLVLRKSFLIFSFLLIYFIGSAFNIPDYLKVSLSLSVHMLSWFGSSLPSVHSLSSLFLLSMAHFSMPNSIPVFLLGNNLPSVDKCDLIAKDISCCLFWFNFQNSMAIAATRDVPYKIWSNGAFN